MKREEYEAAIKAALGDLVDVCSKSNFVEIAQFIETSAHYHVELAKRWDFDRDQARHLAHGRTDSEGRLVGKRLTIEKATTEAAAATKRHFRDATFEAWSEKYGTVTDPNPQSAPDLESEPPAPEEHPEGPSPESSPSTADKHSESETQETPSRDPEQRDRARAHKHPDPAPGSPEGSRTSPPPKSGRDSSRKARRARSGKHPPGSPPPPAPESSQPQESRPSKETAKPPTSKTRSDHTSEPSEPSVPSQDSSTPS